MSSKRLPITLGKVDQWTLDSLVLFDTDTATAGELAARMGLTERSVTAPLERLHNRDMVARRSSNLGYVWWPTAKGQRYTTAVLKKDASDEAALEKAS
ncbi:hypothetical protein [Nocardia sp. NPDC055049]